MDQSYVDRMIKSYAAVETAAKDVAGCDAYAKKMKPILGKLMPELKKIVAKKGNDKIVAAVDKLAEAAIVASNLEGERVKKLKGEDKKASIYYSTLKAFTPVVVTVNKEAAASLQGMGNMQDLAAGAYVFPKIGDVLNKSKGAVNNVRVEIKKAEDACEAAQKALQKAKSSFVDELTDSGVTRWIGACFTELERSALSGIVDPYATLVQNNQKWGTYKFPDKIDIDALKGSLGYFLGHLKALDTWYVKNLGKAPKAK